MSFWHLSLDALIERKTRTTLTILMVIIGASLIIGVNGMSNGTVAFIKGQFSGIGANLLMLTPQSEDFKINDRIVREVGQVEGIEEAVPYVQQGVLLKSGSRTMNSFLIGMDQSKLPLIFPSISFKEGNIVSETDSLGMIVGNDIHDGEFTHFGDNVRVSYLKTGPTGRPMEVSRTYSVRGMMNYLGSNFIPVDQMAGISLESAKDFFDRKDVFDGIYVLTEDPSVNGQVRDRLRERFNVNVINPESITSMIAEVTDAVASFVNSVAIVSLGVAAIGIIAAQYTSLMERIKEIGTMKAIGYTERQILVLFLNEAIMVGIVGGTIGVISGIGLGYVLNEVAGSRSIIPTFDIEVFVFTWVLCIVLAILAGLYPAWRAAKLDPVVALRKE
ncbi:MAG: ABC transporter permease [Candidatus Hodarchaeales archaeon]|jgi:putative ABC transport system permease protein